MNTLFKLRHTYNKHNKCKTFFAYFFIPIPIVIVFILMAAGAIDKYEALIVLPVSPMKEISHSLFSDKFQVKFSDYSRDEKHSPSQMSSVHYQIVCNNKTIQEEVRVFLNNKGLHCFSDPQTAKVPKNQQAIIIIDYDKGKDSFLVDLEQNVDGSPFTILNTEEVRSPVYIPKDQNTYSYSIQREMDFMFFQRCFAEYLIQRKNKQANKKLDFVSLAAVIPGYIEGKRGSVFNDGLETVGSVAVSVLSFINHVLVLFIISIKIMFEKEKGLTKFLQRYSITAAQYYFCWFIFYELYVIVPDVFQMAHIAVIGGFHKAFYIFNVVLFNLSFFCYAFFVQSLMQTGKRHIIHFLCFFAPLPFFYISQGPQVAYFFKVLMFFFPQFIHFHFLINYFKLYKFFDSTGLFTLNIYNTSMANLFSMYIVDIVLYIILGCFFICYRKSKLPFMLYVKSFFTKIDILPVDNNANISLSFAVQHQEVSKKNSEHMKKNELLDVVSLNKYTENSNKIIDNFTGKFFPDEIFALVGYKGAGISTLIDMLGGFADIDRGEANLNGLSLKDDQAYLASTVGVCQENAEFFDYISVMEHIQIFRSLSGQQDDVIPILTRLGLGCKQNVLIRNLSEIDKQMFKIAFAMCTGSKVILFDNPTRNLEEEQKAVFYKFLRDYKANKIIIVGTNSLDEAEEVGERIGVLKEGRFICSGTEFYLKQKYPYGNNLRLLINKDKFTTEKMNKLNSDLQDIDTRVKIAMATKTFMLINIDKDVEKHKEIISVIKDRTKDSESGIVDYNLISSGLDDIIRGRKDNIPFYRYRDENLEPKIPESSDIRLEQKEQIKLHFCRNILTIFRNTSGFFVVLIWCIFLVYVYLIIFRNYTYFLISTEQNNVNMFKHIDTFTDEASINNIKSSFFYDKYNPFRFSKLDSNNATVYELRNKSHEKAVQGVVKTAFKYTKSNDGASFFNVYQYDSKSGNFFYSNVIVAVSTFLKTEYDINAVIFNKMKAKNLHDFIGTSINVDSGNFITVTITCALLMLCLLVYAGFIIKVPIDENLKGIKHILRLSKAKMSAYWFGLYFADLIRLFIFFLVCFIPLFIIDGKTYILIFAFLIFYCFSFLPFIYWFSFWTRKTHCPLFTFVIVTSFIMMIIVAIYYVTKDRSLDPQYLFTPFSFIYFDILPQTNFVFHFLRIGIANYYFRFMDNEVGNLNGVRRPVAYMGVAILRQLIPLALYGILLALEESGVLRKFGLCCKHCCYDINKAKVRKYVSPVCVQEREDLDVNDIGMNQTLLSKDSRAPSQTTEMQIQMAPKPGQPIPQKIGAFPNNANQPMNKPLPGQPMPQKFDNFPNQPYQNQPQPQKFNNFPNAYVPNNQQNAFPQGYQSNQINMGNTGYQPPMNQFANQYNNNMPNINQNMNQNMPKNMPENQAPLIQNNFQPNSQPFLQPKAQQLNYPSYPYQNQPTTQQTNQNVPSPVTNQPYPGQMQPQPNLQQVLNQIRNNNPPSFSENIPVNQDFTAPAPIVPTNYQLIDQDARKTNQMTFVKHMKNQPDFYLNNMLNKALDSKSQIKVKHLTKYFGKCCFGCNITATPLYNFSLGVSAKEKMALLGKRKSGKSTFYKILTDILSPDSGEAILYDLNPNKNMSPLKNKIGYCPQDNPIFDYMTVRETLQFYVSFKGSDEDIDELASKFKLDGELMGTLAKNLTKTSKRNLSLAISFINKPKLLLLDEPSSDMDLESKVAFWSYIIDLENRGYDFNVIFSTFSDDDVEMLSDNFCYMKEGNLIMTGNPELVRMEYFAGYKMKVKFDFTDIKIKEKNDESNINNEEEIKKETEKEVEFRDYSDLKTELFTLISGFNNFVPRSKEIIDELVPYLDGLIKVLRNIKDYCRVICLNGITQDYVFKIMLDVHKEKQGEFFESILSMKKKVQFLENIEIKFDELSKILTRFDDSL